MLLAVMVVMFYGCKQMAHIEKDNHDFELPGDTLTADSVRLPERIIDTITFIADTLDETVFDTIAEAQNVASLQQQDSLSQDSLIAIQPDVPLQDSLSNDTLIPEKPRRNRIAPKRSGSAIETMVICSASDSVYRDMNQKKIFYYGNAEAKYDDITLKASCLEFDLETSTCRAYGVLDSLGKRQGKPVFTQGESTFEAVEMLYNFKTKKGIITKVWTEEQGGYLHGGDQRRIFLKV